MRVVQRSRFETTVSGLQITEHQTCNDDSKWLFTIRSERDLKVLTEEVPRIVLALADYPHFDAGDFETLRFFRSMRFGPRMRVMQSFPLLMKGYFESIYQGHKQVDSGKTPAPKNFLAKVISVL